MTLAILMDVLTVLHDTKSGHATNLPLAIVYVAVTELLFASAPAFAQHAKARVSTFGVDDLNLFECALQRLLVLECVIFARSIDFVLFPFTNKFSVLMLETSIRRVMANSLPVIFPNECPAAIAHVFFPIAHVFIAIRVLQLADSFAPIVDPVSSVLRAISTKVRAFAVFLVQDPIANVMIAVKIGLFSMTVTLVSPPLALNNKSH
jgi:hypothetical protein